MPPSKNPIFYHGGKARIAADLVALCPSATLFLDVCGGSGSVAVAAKESGRFHTVIYNELDAGLTNLLVSIRDRAPALAKLARDTPVSRAYFEELCGRPRSEDPLLAALEVFYLLYFSGHAVSTPRPDTYRRPLIRHERSVPHSPAAWNIRIDALEAFSARLNGIAIENRDAADILRLYGAVKPYWRTRGSEQLVLLFVDPPYGKTQNYARSVDKTLIAAALDKENPYVLVLGDPTEATVYGRAPDSLMRQENNNKNPYTTAIWANFSLRSPVPASLGLV